MTCYYTPKTSYVNIVLFLKRLIGFAASISAANYLTRPATMMQVLKDVTNLANNVKTLTS